MEHTGQSWGRAVVPPQKAALQEPEGLMGQGGNTGTRGVWYPTAGRSPVWDDTICHSHQLSPTRHTVLPCCRSTIPSFHCCPRQCHVPRAALKSHPARWLLTASPRVTCSAGLLHSFPSILLKCCPKQGKDLSLIHKTSRSCPPPRWRNIAILSKLRQKPLYTIKAKPKYSFPCSSLNFINGGIYYFSVSWIKGFKDKSSGKLFLAKKRANILN